MENNSEKWQDHKNSSLGAAILSLSYPFDSVQEKIDVVTKHATDKETALRLHFRKYFEGPETYQFYGLTINL